jgi:hypothetical protein
METVVYGPFVLIPLVVALSRLTSRRLRPRAAAWAVTGSALAVAVATVGSLGLLLSPLVGRVPLVAEVGGWQPASVAVRSPVPWWISAGALLALAALGWRVVVWVGRVGRDVSAIGRVHDEFGSGSDRGVVVVDSPAVGAHALPRTLRRPGRVLVSRGLLAVLDDDEQAAVVAHEGAHLRHGHALFVVAIDLAVALNPLLQPMGDDVRLAVERWADEDAGAATDRAVMASALAKAALATLSPPTAAGAWWMHLHDHAVAVRVAALLDEPHRGVRAAWLLVGIALLAAGALVWATHDTEQFFEAVRLFRRR